MKISFTMKASLIFKDKKIEDKNMKTRCQFFYLPTFCLVLTTLMLAPLAALQAASAKQPNVLLILTDDQGYGDLSIHGNTHLQTPHIDRLGTEGVDEKRGRGYF